MYNVLPVSWGAQLEDFYATKRKDLNKAMVMMMLKYQYLFHLFNDTFDVILSILVKIGLIIIVGTI